MAMKQLEEDTHDVTLDSVDGGQLYSQINELLQRAYRIQENYERRLFKQMNTSVAMTAALEEMDRDWEAKKRMSVRSIDTYESSDQESFVSALEMADLSDLEDLKENCQQHLELYEAALEELSQGNIGVRTLRTQVLQCQSDSEFLAKLQCVRLAFQELMKDSTVRQWFVEMGRDILSSLITQADREPQDFQAAYAKMVDFVEDAENWPKMEEELRDRGVQMVNFFDIVLDFILLDSFEDLDSPPSSVLTVIQNRWLSNGFKETALSTAVWSVLKAKRRMLKYSNGFIAHFYDITEHLSPLLAWGFLGTCDELKQLCVFFKEQVLGLLCDIFCFEKVRYTTVQHLADDILKLIRLRKIEMERIFV
ncbi:hypothetical protein CAPTEDRAFT_148737 [Capitella teleta]|uniref:Uncharacterized protein n=2 Tax=Capitella teleta TaxID=283909 RepID=R7TPY7_CAPTE|nr:hypothetical protein CAPTEDRAFT_148737 [Capitella teleta]|eukprot:ELT95948.1 hypothetical protein CAPTEDRAFT_148737 [Capitella teleta]